MFGLSQTTGYAIQALGCLLESGDGWDQAEDIAVCTAVPLPYLRKILNALSRAGLVETKRGYRGGYRLTSDTASMTVFDVAAAVEGGEWPLRCIMGFSTCSDGRCCPAHNFWKTERFRIETELRRITIRDVVQFERDQPGSIFRCCHKTREGEEQVNAPGDARPATGVSRRSKKAGLPAAKRARDEGTR